MELRYLPMPWGSPTERDCSVADESATLLLDVHYFDLEKRYCFPAMLSQLRSGLPEVRCFTYNQRISQMPRRCEKGAGAIMFTSIYTRWINSAGVMLIRSTDACRNSAPILPAVAKIRAMLRPGKGSIVNISSAYGKVGGPNSAVYVGSKVQLASLVANVVT
jgi:NAD(P)-dependent dehydrogenase (short-subunit alcohol dehydrogenase family)